MPPDPPSIARLPTHSTTSTKKSRGNTAVDIPSSTTTYTVDVLSRTTGYTVDEALQMAMQLMKQYN